MKLIDVLLICERIQKIANKEKAPFNEAIVSMAKKLGKKIAEYYIEEEVNGEKVKRYTAYGQWGGEFSKGNSKIGTKYWWKNLDIISQWKSKKKVYRRGPGIDCSSFVIWVLNECGFTDQMWQFSSSFFINENGRCKAAKYFKNGYTLIPVTKESDIISGDILWCNGHIAFAAKNGSFKYQYGMGGDNSIDSFKDSRNGITRMNGVYGWRVVKK